jgi:MFS family permease
VQDYFDHLRAFSPDARLFLAAAALGGVSGGVTNLLLNLYLVALGYPESALPGFVRFGLAGAAAAALAGGPLVDAIQPRRAMLAGTALAALGAALVLVATTPAVLGAGLLAASAGSVVVYIAAPPFLMRHSGQRERPYLFGVVAAAYVISTAAGAALGGFLPGALRAALGSGSDASVYRLALLAGGLLSALGIPLLAMTREGPISSAAPAASTTGSRSALQEAASTPATSALRDLPRRLLDPAFIRLVAQFVLADGLIRVGGNLFIPYLNVFFVRHLGASEALYGSLRFGERALVVVATLLVALFVTRYGPVATVVLTQVLSVPLLLVLGFAPTLGVAATAFLLRGPLMEMTQPTRDNFLMEVAPAPARASAFAALTLAGYVIGFGASFLAERLLAGGSFGVAFLVAGALYVASAAMYWLFFRARPEAAPRRAAAPPAALAS